MTLNGKTLVVTGVASGIGAELARLARFQGAYVIGVDRNQPQFSLDDFHQADLGDPDSIAALGRLLGALKSRGVLTEEELAARQASTDAASPETGARMVARAWLDPAYRALLLSDGKAAAEAVGKELGFPVMQTPNLQVNGVAVVVTG